MDMPRVRCGPRSYSATRLDSGTGMNRLPSGRKVQLENVLDVITGFGYLKWGINACSRDLSLDCDFLGPN